MFKIIEQPNDFAKNVKRITQSGDINDSQASRLEFWTRFNDLIDSKGKPFNKHKATTDHWYTIAIGSSQCYISIDLVNKEHFVRLGILVPNNKALFDSFYADKDAIEAELGMTLDWDRLDGKKAATICIHIPGLDFDHQDNYPALMDQIIETAVKFKKVFSKRL